MTNLNNTTGKTLQFQVNGVVADADVELFADGVSIGHAIAAGTSVVITTNGIRHPDRRRPCRSPPSRRSKNQAVNVGNLNTTTDLASAASAALSVTVEAAPPQFNFTPITAAREGTAYYCTVTTALDAAAPVTYALTQPPTGMTINATTGVISWTPSVGQAPTAGVTVVATDLAGNSAQQQFTINVAAAQNAPVLTAASPSIAYHRRGYRQDDRPDRHVHQQRHGNDHHRRYRSRRRRGRNRLDRRHRQRHLGIFARRHDLHYDHRRSTTPRPCC